MKFLKNDSGFTLVELMVVVAIIGILSAVAIPNFRTYQAKSKTSEAKLALASIYSAETSFASDYDTYGTCMEYMGYEVQTGRLYASGFLAHEDGTAATFGNLLAQANGASTECSAADDVQGYAADKRVSGASLAAIADLDTNVTTTVTATTFLASAVGSIDSKKGQFDVWSINEDKSLVHAQKGY